MVFLLAQQTYALGLGEIQIHSFLGEPLRAQVDLTDLNGEYESSLKVRLASVDEYKKGGYPYPYDKRFKFEIVNEDGKHPRVQVTSLYPIDDPFLYLLMEVNSPTGRIIRTFTFLLDPAPELFHGARAVSANPQIAPVAASRPVVAPAAIAETPPAITPARPAPSSKPRASNVHSRRNRPMPVAPRAAGITTDVSPAGKLSLSLSTSLSISSNDPSLPLNSKDSSDALQEELIAKEKTLKELNEQITEMQSLIKGLQIKLSMTASSAVAASTVLADVDTASGIAAASPVEAVSAVSAITVAAPVAAAPEGDVTGWGAWFKSHRNVWLAGLAGMALALAGYYWWRQRKLERGWIPKGLFDDLASSTATAETASPAAPVAPLEQPQPVPPVPTVEAGKVATKKLAVGEQSMKVPAFKEQKAAPSTLPPEYDLLEEANIYLRFGHDKLAEEVLYDALKINAKNPDIYMTLLGIFDTRTDAQGYEKLAKEFKVIADADTWKKVAAMGKKLDIGNSLYDQ